MTLFPLVLAFAVLALLVLSGTLLLYLRSRKIDRRLSSMERDLRQFYRDLGRPKAEIINIRGRQRPS